MPDTWAKIYMALLICSGLFGVFVGIYLIINRPYNKDEPLSRRLLQKNFLRGCLHLIVGAVALGLFKLGVLGSWGVIIFGGVLLILPEYLLAPLIKSGKVRS